MPSGDFEALKRKIPDRIREISYVKEKLKSSEWHEDSFHINSYYDVVRKLIGDKYYKEAIDILIEIQRQTNRNGIVDLIREIPLNDSICHYMEFVLENIKNESEEEIHSALNYICVTYFLNFSKLGSSKFEGRSDVEKEAEIRGIEYALRISNIIINGFPNPSDRFRKKNKWIISNIIEIFVLNNDIEGAEKIAIEYLSDYDISKYFCFRDFTTAYISREKYEKALSAAKYTLKHLVISEYPQHKIRKDKLSFIEILEMNKSYDEAEREYRELGELQKAGEMYERAGMKQKAIEIYTEIEGNNNPVQAGIAENKEEIKKGKRIGYSREEIEARLDRLDDLLIDGKISEQKHSELAKKWKDKLENIEKIF